MPLIKHEQVGDNSNLYVWKIEELMSYFELYVDAPSHIAHPRKALEYITGRFMLDKYVPDYSETNLKISTNGKPFLKDSEIEFSLSHSFPYVALLVSDEPVGVDIQTYTEKILSIAPKFTSAKEVDMKNIEKLTTVWCLKEAAFKWYEKGDVEFLSQIKIPELDFDTPNQTIHFITINGEEYYLNSRYEMTEYYALAYAWSS